MDLDAWALKQRDLFEQGVRERGLAHHGAVLRVTRHPITHAVLSEPADLILVAGSGEAMVLGCKTAVAAFDAIALVAFAPLKASGGGVVFSYERHDRATATDWYAKLEGTELGEWEEILAPTAFFTQPSAPPN